jgi:phosphatidylserine/phosphatidylglycerophosphate/cardiolipin synthase-like enzyme
MQKLMPARFMLTYAVLILALAACDAVAVVPPATSVPAVTLTAQPETATPFQPDQPGALTEIPMKIGYAVQGSFFEIYFTDPFNPAGTDQEGGPDGRLAQAIDQARISVDVAAYSLSLFSIQNALLNARDRGVLVRMVMESDNLDNTVPQTLIDAGIPILGDRRSGLMHDKFVIIDRSEVWMGSMNFTTSGGYDDNNNLVRIRSTKVAENYTVEFEEMFRDDFFGTDAIAETPNSHLTVDGMPLEVYFSPDDNVATRVVELLRGATQSVYFMAYSFTADDFGDVLRQKARDGVVVAGVMEESQVKSNKGTEFDPFQQAGLPVYLDGTLGQMHHKVFVIDQQIVITGSYNFSASAENTNDENVVIFFDPQVAEQYLAEFQRMFVEAQK